MPLSPSARVTQLLEKYIEFDPKELELGIWSGHLSLSNIHLKQDAIYPLLNHGFASQPAQPTDTATNIPSQQQQQQQHSHQKPPLRFKLLQGTIGQLDIQIPWKQLVWTQGDVKVRLDQVVLVLAQETRQETAARRQEQPDEQQAQDTGVLQQQQTTTTPRGGGGLALHQRSRKQKRLEQAERRQLQGAPLEPWLSATRQKDLQKENEREGLHKNSSGPEEGVAARAGRLDTWIRGAANDFFFRLWAGLQIHVENWKIVMMQDGIEVGLVVPSIVDIAKTSDTSTAQEGSLPSQTATPPEPQQQQQPTLSSSSRGDEQEEVRYRGAYQDGEHIDKQFKIRQMGIYVRKQNVNLWSEMQWPVGDVSTDQFILRPLDLDFSFSLFFPYGEHDKRRRKSAKTKKRPQSEGGAALAELASVMTSSTQGKRRRDKRDKSSSAATTEGTSTFDEAEMADTPMFPRRPDRSSLTRGASTASVRSATHPLLKMSLAATPQKGRRPSLYGPGQHAAATHRRQVSVPLAHPNFATTSVGSNTNKKPVARFDGKLTIGAVHMVCSTRHYDLLTAFLAGGARLRNGRPTRTILSVLDHTLHRTLTVTAPADTAGVDRLLVTQKSDGDSAVQVRLELGTARTERSEVISSWWQYALGAVVWELRQRRRLRKAFQERFLSFSWKRQTYRREDYVSLYIKCRLRRETEASPFAVGGLSDEERLLALEDELVVEQILLYRSLARAVHILGKSHMPESILELQLDRKAESPETRPSDRNMDKDTQHPHAEDDRPLFLSILGAHGETARQRKHASPEQILPKFDDSFPTWSDMAKTRAMTTTEMDETSLATILTRDSRLRGDGTSMILSFAIRVEEVEVTIVEEEMFSDDLQAMPNAGENNLSELSTALSVVSDLTDDKRFFRGGKSSTAHAIETESLGDDPVPSTDYLLFRLPEKVILRLKLSPIDLTSTGRSGEFYHVKFSIGLVKVFGAGENDVLVMGHDSSGENAPVHEVSFPPPRRPSRSVTTTLPPNSAVSLSLDTERQGVTVQCDAATVRLVLDMKTVEKSVDFVSQHNSHFPKSLLKMSPREEVRLYVLRQSTNTDVIALNSSVRLYGVEVTFPHQTKRTRGASSSSMEITEASSFVLRSDIIEIYSGSVVDSISSGDSRPELATTNEDPMDPSPPPHKLQTRSLRMIDEGDLSLGSPLSQRWVSFLKQ